jgi:hypothetical protein
MRYNGTTSLGEPLNPAAVPAEATPVPLSESAFRGRACIRRFQ